MASRHHMWWERQTDEFHLIIPAMFYCRDEAWIRDYAGRIGQSVTEIFLKMYRQSKTDYSGAKVITQGVLADYPLHEKEA